MRRFLLVAGFFAGFVLPAAPASAADQAVGVFCNYYAAKTVTITEGDSVTWTNMCGYHDVVFDDGSFREPPQPQFPPWTVSRAFSTQGTFRYYCSQHGGPGGVGMAGTVVVNPPPAVPGRPSPPATSPSGGSAPQRTTPAAPPGGPLSRPKCASRRKFRIRIREPRGIRIRSARVVVNDERVPVRARTLSGRKRWTATVDLRGLPRGIYEVKIVAVTRAGKALHGTRRYRTCAKKQTRSSLPRL